MSGSTNNEIGFVTSALGLQPVESLEIIEDADEIEEDEIDNINLNEVNPSGNLPSSRGKKTNDKNFSSNAPYCAEPVVPMTGL